MAKQEEKARIDGKDYIFTQLPPRKSAKLFLWATGLGGAAAGKAVSGMKQGKKGKGILDAEMDFNAVGDALEKLFSASDDPKVEANIDLLLDCVLFSGQPLSMDHLNFQGEVLHMFKVVRKSLEVNYSDFLDVSRGFGAMFKKTMSTLLANQTSTGSSGAQSSEGSAA